VVYGTNAEVNCSVQTQQGGRNLQVDNSLYPFTYVNTENMTVGMHNFTCTFGGTLNYTTANVLKFLNITKATATLDVIAPDTVGYGQITNVSCNLSVFAGPTLNRNGTSITSPDTTLLAAGEYNYTCYWNGDANHYGATDTKFVTVQKAEPVINLTVNGTTNYVVIGLPGMMLDINGTITTPAGGNINLYVNNTLQAGTDISYNFTANVPVKLVYDETENYSYSEKTINVHVGSALIKYNWTYLSGSHVNTTFFSQEFNTNINTTCKWDTNDLNYTQMANTFTTTGTTTHATQITGLTLGTNNLYVACINDTDSTNEDLLYTVDNIIEPTFSLINGATATNSILYSTTVDGNSALNLVNATNSIINRSTLTNCVVINSTVMDKTGSNCYIINSVVDPSDVTNSTINSSTITNSNATNSYVDHSTIINSDMDSSTIINSDLTNVTGTGTVTSTTLQDVQLIDAVIDNGIITSGTIIQGSVTYNASSNVTANISQLVNLAPIASFTTDTLATTPGTVINFDSSSTTDPNIGQLGPYNSTNMTYYWDFGDGNNLTITNTTTTHSYSADGTYVVVLTATDAYGLSDNTTKTITISTPAPPTPTYSSSGGGGGGRGGGGSLAAMARIYEYDLESGMFFQRGLTMYDTLNIKYSGKIYEYKVSEIKRAEYAIVTINNIPYKFVDKEIKQIDLDGNHYYDIEVSFINNYVTRAEFRMKPVHEIVPGYNSNAPAQTTVKPGQSAIIDKLQEAQRQLEQEQEEEEIEPETPVNEAEEGISLLSSALGLAKTLVSSMKGTVTGAVTAGAELDEKGGATGTIITILVVVLGLLGYWAYNRFL